MIRQLHYTSSRRGRDGIQGFQVAAATPDVARRHEDLALPLAAYRPPPSAPAVPSPAEIAAMPVALGFRDFGEVAVLFRSHYLGQDFTGRQGNYFAHLLITDRPAFDLAGVVPAATWEAAFWNHGMTGSNGAVTLPPLDGLPPPRPDVPRVDDATVTALLAAVRDALAGRVRQIVLVGQWPDPAAQVAAAVLAVTAALPTLLTRRLSFTTFTATPRDADVLVVGTTPDVTLGADDLRNRCVLRLGEQAACPDSVFAAVVRRRRGDPVALAALVAFGDAIRPPVQPDELDALAAAAVLVDGSDPDADPLPGLEFLVARHPAALGPAVWERVETAVGAGAAPVTDLERWSAVLGRTEGHRPLLEAAYLRAALTRLSDVGAPGELWLPAIAPGSADAAVAAALAAVEQDPEPGTALRALRALERLGVEPADADLAGMCDLVLLPLVLDRDADVGPFHELALAPRLVDAMAGLLERRLSDDLIGAAAEGMSTDAARWLAEAAAPDGRVAIATAVRLAAAGERDAVDVVVGHAPDAAALDRLVAWVWAAEPPTAADGLRLLRRMDPAVVVVSGLPATLASRLTADTLRGGDQDDEALASRLLELGPDLPAAVRNCAEAVRLTGWFRVNDVYADGAMDHVRAAVEVARSVDPAVAAPMATSLVRWLFASRNGVAHADVLEAVVTTGSPAVLGAYTERLLRTLRAAEPVGILEVLPAVVHVAATRPEAEQLLDRECATTLGKRRRRTLDEVGTLLSKRGSVPSELRPGRASMWTDWWKGYRESRLDQQSQGVRGRISRLWGS
jgi:GTPase-associated protein 1